jgi:hypothetical protein
MPSPGTTAIFMRLDAALLAFAAAMACAAPWNLRACHHAST